MNAPEPDENVVTTIDTTSKDPMKAEANRKKKERQKAAKVAQKAEAAKAEAGVAEATFEEIDAVLPSAEAIAAGAAAAPVGMRSARRDAGEERGFGMFASEALAGGDEIASTLPALSVVFDDCASEVCGFCFTREDKPSRIEVALELKRGAGGFGILLDDRSGARGLALVAGVVQDGPNAGAVRIGDRFVSVDGLPVAGGHEEAIMLLKAACERLGDGVPVPAVLSRPSHVVCAGCGKFSACASCVAANRLEWHRHECKAFQALPTQAKAGADTSVLRLLTRFRITQTAEFGDWSERKETTSALTSLQRNPVNLEKGQLATLATLAGISANDAGALISMVRTNACQIERPKGRKAGCALSALVGWHNHDCAPSAAATVMDDGRLAVCALRDVREGEEVCLSYVDVTQPRERRREVLGKHYGFECRCERCKLEQRASLRNALKDSQQRRR